MHYTAEDIQNLFPQEPTNDNPNVITHRSSSVQPGTHGLCGWVFVVLNEGERAWDPRGGEDFEGPCRVIYDQYLDGAIILGYQGPL
jgi:hypothetical protein